MSRLHLNAVYSYRYFLSAALFLTAVYFVLYTGLATPPLALFLSWYRDTDLIVIEPIGDEYRPYLQSGDIVLVVDGRVVQRGQPVFVLPVEKSYEITIQRGKGIFTQEIPIYKSQLFQVWLLSTGVLALAFWFIGFMTVRFARPQQIPPLYIGFGFQMIATGIVSPGPAQLGAPGAWIIGNVLIFFFPLIMLYLGFFPRYTPLAAPARKLLRGSAYLLTVFAAIAAMEVIYLFPERSLWDLVGIRSITILTILTGISIVAAVTILFVRLIRSPKRSYERQQLSILCAFLGLAVIPLFFFVILPVDEYLFVPFPFVYSLFLLAPAAYFFVLHRHGHLELDALFSRIVTVVFLTLAVGMAYTTGVYLLSTVLQPDLQNFGQGGVVLVLFGIAIIGQKQVNEWVALLLYGRDPMDQNSFQTVATLLSANPEPATVADVVKQVAIRFNVGEVAVLVGDGPSYKFLAGSVPAFKLDSADVHQVLCLRSKEQSKFMDLPEWVELSLPIKARGDMLGLFLLARPLNGYFNARQVAMLQDMADILAFGLLVISLVDKLQGMSWQATLDQERQRQQIATEIHNIPLQTLAGVTMQLQRHASDNTIREAADTLRQATQDLRRIIAGLRPPALRESIEWMTRQLIREFAETHEDIVVTLHPPDIRDARQTAELTKQAFFYILTEILNNISKHAHATAVVVWLYIDEGSIRLTVSDNGIGPSGATHPLTELLRRHHIGVSYMYRWASMAGGMLEILANIPSGTTVKLVLPTITESGK